MCLFVSSLVLYAYVDILWTGWGSPTVCSRPTDLGIPGLCCRSVEGGPTLCWRLSWWSNFVLSSCVYALYLYCCVGYFWEITILRDYNYGLNIFRCFIGLCGCKGITINTHQKFYDWIFQNTFVITLIYGFQFKNFCFFPSTSFSSHNVFFFL